MAELLARDDSAAAKLVVPMAVLLQGHALAPAFARLSDLVQQYDFEGALDALKTLERELNNHDGDTPRKEGSAAV